MNSHFTRAGSVLVGALGLLFSAAGLRESKAAAGDLDPRFGNGGKALTDFSGNDDYAFAVAMQPDGKIVAAGQSGVYPLFHSALTRYNKNGRLDQTFGSGGKVVAALDAGGDGLDALAIQPDGKIVTAGSLIHDNFTVGFILARFNTSGTLDQSFGNNGSIVTTFGDSSAEGHAVVVQADGKIIEVGESGAGSYSALNDFALARFNADGSVDQSFGNGGKIKTHFPGVFNTGSRGLDAVLQPDGKLLVAGTYKNEGTYAEFALARYNTNGTLDTTFGSAGKVTTFIASADAIAFALALQADSKIVLAGYTAGFRNGDFALARYNSDGTLDQSFATGGIVTTDLFGTTDDIAYGLLIQRDGKLIAAGRTGQYPSFDFGLVRYQSNGQLDPTFGSGGKVATDIGDSEQGYGVALQRNGGIVLGGYSFANGGGADFTLTRYLGH
jgi:uncharacterized delta-60 repeat protein